jgi:hypothetical protein
VEKRPAIKGRGNSEEGIGMVDFGETEIFIKLRIEN